MAAGVEVDEGGVEADAPAEEAVPAELEGHAESLSRRAEVDEVEGLVPSVVGAGHSAGDDRVVVRIPVTGSYPAKGKSETFADLIRGP